MVRGQGQQIQVDDLPDGLVVADGRGRVTAWNAAAERLTGTPAAAAVGQLLADVLPLRDRRDRQWWACARPFDGLVTRTGHPEVELMLPGRGRLLVTARYQRKAGPGTSVTDRARLVAGDRRP